MEVKRRLLGIGCVGLGLVMTMAAAVWHSGPERLQAAQGGEDPRPSSSGPAVAPSPPPVRTDIRSSRLPPPTVSAPAPAPTSAPAAAPRSEPRSNQQVAPSPPPIRPDVRPPQAAAISPPVERLPKDKSLSESNLLRKEPPKPTYPATGQPTVSQTTLLRVSDAQPGGPETMLDGNLLLVEAHELAEQAEGVQDWTRIVELCHAGIQAGVGPEAVQFAHQLTSWAYNRRGDAYEGLGEAHKALVDFNAAVRHDPARWQAVHNRGVSLAQAGRIAEAREDFTKTIQLQPRYAKAYSNRAAISEQQGKHHEALKDFQRAAELNQKLAAAHAGIGRVLLRLGRSQEALLALNDAVRLDRDNPAYLTSRGDVYAGLGEYEAALGDYGKAIEVDPSFATAYRNGAWLLATCPDDLYRDEENAVVGAEKALDLAVSERHLCLDALAAAHANAGRFDQALQVARQAIEEAPQGVRTFYEARRKLYEQRKPYRTQPVQTAAFVQTAD